MGITQRRIKRLFRVTIKLKVNSDNAAEEVQPEGAQRQRYTSGILESKENIMKKAQVETGIEEWVVFSCADMGVDTGSGISGRGTSTGKDWETEGFT